MPDNPKPYPEIARARIRTGQLITRLHKHAMGEVEMKSTQIQAARILLDKTIPNLAQVQQDVNITHATADSLTDDILAHIAAGGRSGTAVEEASPQKPADVH